MFRKEFEFVYEAEDGSDVLVEMEVEVDCDLHPANERVTTYNLLPRVQRVYDKNNTLTNAYNHLWGKMISHFRNVYAEDFLERFVREQSS